VTYNYVNILVSRVDPVFQKKRTKRKSR